MSAIIDPKASALELSFSLVRGALRLTVQMQTKALGVGLFGVSGAGKSTVLAAIAGLVIPEAGRIRLGDDVLFDHARGLNVPAHKRRIALMFQDALLFPHLNVRENLVFGRPAANSEAVSRFDELVSLLGLEALLARKPASLSGGERQRVALGRAVMSDPRLLLLDEPLTALDRARRQEVMGYLVALRERFRLPMVVVSHAVDELVRLVDEVFIISEGTVSAAGAPANLLLPSAGGDAGFGQVRVLEAIVSGYDEFYGLTSLDHPAGRISLPGRIGTPGQPHRILVRATDVAIAVSRPREISHRTQLRARITAMAAGPGPLVEVSLELEGGGQLTSLITRKAVDELAIDVGDAVWALTKATAMDDRAFTAR